MGIGERKERTEWLKRIGLGRLATQRRSEGRVLLGSHLEMAGREMSRVVDQKSA